MTQTADRLVHIPNEYAQHLSELAVERGTTESALVEEALALLFCTTAEERESLAALLAATGPSEARRVPTLSPEDIAMVIPVPLEPSRLRRELG